MQLAHICDGQHHIQIQNYYIHMLCAKSRLGQSSDSPAQSSDPRSPNRPKARQHTTNVVHVYAQSFACWQWLMYIGWRIVHCETFEKWTKETFLFRKKVGSKVSLLLNNVTINFQSRRLWCTFPSSTLYTFPSMIDFWSRFLRYTSTSTSTFSKVSCVLHILDWWITCLQYSKMIMWHRQSEDHPSSILCAPS